MPRLVPVVLGLYLRESKQKRADGRVITYLQLAENVWNPEKGRSQARIVYNCGRGDDPQALERLRRLARSILRRCAPEEIVAEQPAWSLVCAWPYGDVHVLEAFWRRLGIDAVIRRELAQRRFGFDMERALFAMVANRACAPASKLYCHEQWLKEDAYIPGARALELHPLYRAMDFLEANKEAIEQAIYFQVADLLNLDVDIVSYDTPSLHFEIDEEDADGPIRGSTEAGRKDYAGARKRGHSKNGRQDAAQIVVGLAVTREGFPVRHWVFPGNTVDVTTVSRVKEELKGWQLSRCLFVGDAGMVSQANLQSLADKDEDHSKRACALRSSARYGRLLKRAVEAHSAYSRTVHKADLGFPANRTHSATGDWPAGAREPWWLSARERRRG